MLVFNQGRKMKKYIALSIIMMSAFTYYLPASQDIRQLARERLERQQERFKAQLTKEFERACQESDLAWITKNQQHLLEQHVVGREELDMTLKALEEPAKKKQRIDQEKTDCEHTLRMTAIERMQKALSTQEAITNGLAWLYAKLSNKREFVTILKEIGLIQNLEVLFNRLNQLTENQDIMAIIGKEVQQLRGHMLYRVWVTPQEITSNTDLAMQALKEAIIRNDFNAIINIYRDAIRQTTAEHEAMKLLNNCFIQAIERNDTTAVVDLYLNVFKGSVQEEASLLLIDEYAQCLLRNRNLEALKKLRICLEHTQYIDSLLETITSLEVAMGITPTMPSQTSQQKISVRNLWDEWQAACINRNLDQLLALRDQVIQQGIVETDVANAIIESII
jgi:hypothetical protein